MKRILNVFREFFGGFLIALASYASLVSGNNAIGFVFIAFALLAIVTFQFSLYTERVGYGVFIDDSEFYIMLYSFIRTLLFNTIGILIAVGVFKLSHIPSEVYERVIDLANAKVSYPGTGFFFGIFTGILVFIGCSFCSLGRQAKKNPVEGIAVLMLCVAVFEIARFDHFFESVFYLFLAGTPMTTYSFGYLCMVLLGNTIGTIVAAWLCYPDGEFDV